MEKISVKLLGFFIGFFITLFIINYINITNKKIEKFSVIVPTKESYTNSSSTTAVTENKTPDFSMIPYKSNKYMCINTFFDNSKISNTEGRWYECELDIKDRNPENNKYHYFTYDKIINLKPNTINNTGSSGADINTIQLNGPKSFYFANNVDNNELKEFSMVMSLKIKDITDKNNIIFEMTGNTETVNTNSSNLQYTFSIININIIINQNGNYDFILTIGNNVYRGNINNIDKNLIKNGDFLVICLIYTQTKITFMINRQMYTYDPVNNFQIKLSSTPIIINKGGIINMELYNFIYYKSVIPIAEYLNCFQHNYHYLSGLNTVLQTSKEKTPETKTDTSNILNDKLTELETKLSNYFETSQNSNETTTMEKILPFNINTNNKPSNSFFSFLF